MKKLLSVLAVITLFTAGCSVTQGNVVEGDNLKVKLTANGGSDVVDAGEYTINAICLNSNYSVTFVNSGEKLLTIAKADSKLKPFELEAQYSYTGELLHNVIYNNQNINHTCVPYRLPGCQVLPVLPGYRYLLRSFGRR